jgi:hypothetical protein
MLPGFKSRTTPAKPINVPSQVSLVIFSRESVLKRAIHNGSAAIISETTPVGTCFEETATLPKPKPRVTKPRTEALRYSALGITNSLLPFVKKIKAKRINPASEKRIPIERSGGIVAITFAMAK